MIGNPSITIIVPIYQSESTLRRCINSILFQTFEKIEVLLVNDGSTDDSGNICEEFASKDSRVRLFNKPHSGVSDARQIGLENAIGEYVIYCDSDDWMEPNMLEELYKKAKESDADMVVCEYWAEFGGRSVRNSLLPIADISGQPHNLAFCVWNKLIHMDCIKKYSLHFPPSVCYAEDLYFILRLLNTNPRISYVSHPLYHYDKKNERSLTHNPSPLRFESHKTVLISLSGCLNETLNKILNKYKCAFLYEAYKNRYYTIFGIVKNFPEAHSLILPLAINHYWRNIYRELQKCCSAIARKI